MFGESVYAIVVDVPRGCVITYGAIARLLGDPRAARRLLYVNGGEQAIDQALEEVLS